MFSQQSLICSLESMKKRAYNPPFAVNALFLFGITGKCHLSVNKQYIFFFWSSHEEESRKSNSARRTEYETLCISICSGKCPEGLCSLLHRVSQCYSGRNTTQTPLAYSVSPFSSHLFQLTFCKDKDLLTLHAEVALASSKLTARVI